MEVIQETFFTEQLRELDKLARVFSHFQDTVDKYFNCRDFLKTKTWSVIQEFELCHLESSVLLSAFDKQIAFTKACHNMYHIFKMFGVNLAESMDIVASLFGEVVNIVYLRSESGLQRERLASVLTDELSQYKQQRFTDDESEEIYQILCYLGSIIYNYIGEEHTIYSRFEPIKRK